MIEEADSSGDVDDLSDIRAWLAVEVDGDLDFGLACFPGHRGFSGHCCGVEGREMVMGEAAINCKARLIDGGGRLWTTKQNNTSHIFLYSWSQVN